MNSILCFFVTNRAFTLLSLVIVAAAVALAVQAVIGIATAQVPPDPCCQYCHCWCIWDGLCFWICKNFCAGYTLGTGTCPP